MKVPGPCSDPTQWLGNQVLYMWPLPYVSNLLLHPLPLFKSYVNSGVHLFYIFPCRWLRRKVRSPGDNWAIVSSELSCRVSHLNFAFILLSAELLHSFHGKAFHQMPYTHSALGSLSIAFWTRQWKYRSSLPLSYSPKPTLLTCHIHSSTKNIMSASSVRGGELGTEGSELKAQTLVLHELTD